MYSGNRPPRTRLLRRALFEHLTRLKYYRKHPNVARAHLEDFDRLAKLFHKRLDDDAFELLLDSTFNAPAHDRQARSFEEMVRDVFPSVADDFCARFYSYPSAILHGDSLVSSDVLELVRGATSRLHLTSRRQNTAKDVLYNYFAFFIGLLHETAIVLGSDPADIVTLQERLRDIRISVGIGEVLA
jgi:hypothetical protein